MNICLQNNEGTLQCLDGFKICFDENMFRDSVKKISEDISKNYLLANLLVWLTSISLALITVGIIDSIICNVFNFIN